MTGGCVGGRDRRGARGAATVVAIAFLGVLLLVGMALAVVAAMVVAHRTAQGAADLAALAGAQEAVVGGDGCARAAVVAEANGARLVACRVSGAEVRVRVEVDGPRVLGRADDFAAEARAGPAG